MIEIILNDNLTGAIASRWRDANIFSTRKLRAGEIACARSHGLKRYYLPALDPQQSEEFFAAFDRFWDDVIRPYGSDHLFGATRFPPRCRSGRDRLVIWPSCYIR